MAGRNPKGSASESESNTRNSHGGGLTGQSTSAAGGGNTGSGSGNSKTSQKMKNQLALQQQQNYLQRHINSNGPKDKPRIDPLDFETMDDSILLKYSERYGFNLPRPESLNSDILNSEIGKKTFTKRKQLKLRAHIAQILASAQESSNKNVNGGVDEEEQMNQGSPEEQQANRNRLLLEQGGRISKKEFANHVRNHFLSLTAKDNDIITGFLYKVKHQDKEFKLTFQ